jgi:hypothetical protein
VQVEEARSRLERTTAERAAGEGAVLVVADSGLVVGEKDLADQVAPAAHTGLVEHALEVLLNGVHGDDETLGNVGGRVAL